MATKLYLREALAKDAVSTSGDTAQLVELWQVFNLRHFDGALTQAVIRLDEPSAPIILGQYSPIGGDGLGSTILIRPSLLAGTHPIYRRQPSRDGLANFVADVLLHEMVHQYCHEVLGQPDAGYHGHGPAFRDTANRIGRDLDLGPVRTCKRRGSDADLPSASHWPHNVRSPQYYQGAIRRDDEAAAGRPADLRGVLTQRLRHLTDGELVKLAQRWPVVDDWVIEATRPAIPSRRRAPKERSDATA